MANLKDPNVLWDHLMIIPELGMTMGVKQVGLDALNPELSFSGIAMDQLFTNIHAFIGTRLMRQWGGTGIGPKKMNVKIEIDFDSEVELNMFTVHDTQHREKTVTYNEFE